MHKRNQHSKIRPLLEEFLERPSLLSYISNEEIISDLLEKCHLVDLNEGEIPFNKDDHSEDLFVVIEGKLSLLGATGKEEPKHDDELLSGQVLNLYPVLMGVPNHYGAVAEENSKILKMPSKVFHESFSKVDGLINYLQMISENTSIKYLANDIY